MAGLICALVHAMDDEFHPLIGDGGEPRTCRFCQADDLSEEQMVMHRLLNELSPPDDDDDDAPCTMLVAATADAAAKFAEPFALKEVSADVQQKAWEVVYDSLNLDEQQYRCPDYVRMTLVRELKGLGCRSYSEHPNGLDEKGVPITRATQNHRDTQLAFLAEALVNKDAISSVPVASAIAAVIAEGLDGPVQERFEALKKGAAGQNRAKGFKLPDHYKEFPYA